MSRILSYRPPTLLNLMSLLCLASLAGPAAAAPCYVVLDRSDNVVYQGTLPPVDLSSAGDAARDALRKRGDVLINFDTTNCPQRKPSLANGKSEASVDEIVAGIRSYSLEGRSSDPGAAGGASSGGGTNAPVNMSTGN
jgi:hypothetical protein